MTTWKTVQHLTFFSFFDEVGRIASPEYVPHEADVLRARTKTTGIYETRFSMGQLSIQYVAPRTLVYARTDKITACSMWEVSEVNGKNGFIVLRT
jgi:hypothetical protein